MTSNSQFPRGIEVTLAAIVRNKEGKILLTTQPKWGGKWLLHGGHVEPGELIMDAAVRETKEETGLVAKPVAIVRFDEIINPPDFHRPIHCVYFDCLLEVEDDTVVMDGIEISDYRWVMPEEALGMDLARGYEKDIQGYIDYLKK